MAVFEERPTPPENRLLAALPPQEHDRLLSHLEPVALDPRQTLYEAGGPIDHVYFPTRGVISRFTVMEDGTRIEVAMVGREGMAGLPVLLGVPTMADAVIVQVPGRALKMRADVLREECERSAPLCRLLYRYVNAFIIQVAQNVACNGLHPLEKRCCRWLLMIHDRVQEDQFPLTQEFLAQMLGVRRASVTEVARAFQKAGLIRYSRGKINILDREGLEAASCECYRKVKEEFDRMLG